MPGERSRCTPPDKEANAPVFRNRLNLRGWPRADGRIVVVDPGTYPREVVVRIAADVYMRDMELPL